VRQLDVLHQNHLRPHNLGLLGQVFNAGVGREELKGGAKVQRHIPEDGGRTPVHHLLAHRLGVPVNPNEALSCDREPLHGLAIELLHPELGGRVFEGPLRRPRVHDVFAVRGGWDDPRGARGLQELAQAGNILALDEIDAMTLPVRGLPLNLQPIQLGIEPNVGKAPQRRGIAIPLDFVGTPHLPPKVIFARDLSHQRLLIRHLIDEAKKFGRTILRV
jgi:hypothetical protein